jgi:hypothetical protein
MSPLEKAFAKFLEQHSTGTDVVVAFKAGWSAGATSAHLTPDQPATPDPYAAGRQLGKLVSARTALPQSTVKEAQG